MVFFSSTEERFIWAEISNEQNVFEEIPQLSSFFLEKRFFARDVLKEHWKDEHLFVCFYSFWL